jgi:hypothetical protein
MKVVMNGYTEPGGRKLMENVGKRGKERETVNQMWREKLK